MDLHPREPWRQDSPAVGYCYVHLRDLLSVDAQLPRNLMRHEHVGCTRVDERFNGYGLVHEAIDEYKFSAHQSHRFSFR